MFVRGERVDELRRPKAAPPVSGRPRYCRRCGGPLGLSSSATNGVRCLNCGAQPGLGLAADSPPRDFTVPRRYAAVAIEPDTTSRGTVARTSRGTVARTSRDTVVRPVAPPIVDMARLRAWLTELSPPSTRTMITAAVAGVAVVAGIMVAMTLG
jgi:hypothetical protein